MKLKCKNCNYDFELRNGEYNRQVKKGRSPDNFFCKQSCASIHNNRTIPYVVTEKRRIILNKLLDVNKTKKVIKKHFAWYVNRCKSRTRQNNKIGKNHEIDIDVEYLKKLWNDQDGICPLSGINMIIRNSHTKHDYNPLNASLDRIDNSKGYVKGNVRFVCLMANYALSTWEDKDLIKFCKQVALNN